MQYKGVIPPNQVDEKTLISNGLDLLPTSVTTLGFLPQNIYLVDHFVLQKMEKTIQDDPS